jgi:hypothetical protein
MAPTGAASPTTGVDGHAEKKDLDCDGGGGDEDPEVSVTGTTFPGRGLRIRGL